MSDTEVFRRRHLPHWDVPGATYFVTACLEGSIPAQGLLDIRDYKALLERRPRPEDLSESNWALRRSKLAFVRVDQWLDGSPAVSHLADHVLAGIVANSLLFFAGTRYDLLALVVMPSHFHWVFRPLARWVEEFVPDKDERTPREKIMHSIKLYTSRECNQKLGQEGPFWQQESYDHWVRDAEELERILNYVEYNPVKAGLCSEAKQWPFSSARYREALGLAFGTPLPRIS